MPEQFYARKTTHHEAACWHCCSLTLNSREVEAGADIEPDHHQKVVVDAAGFLAFKNTYVIGIARLDDMRKEGVQPTLSLLYASNVIPKRQGEKSEVLETMFLERAITFQPSADAALRCCVEHISVEMLLDRQGSGAPSEPCARCAHPTASEGPAP